jgi:replication factor A2
MYGGDFDGNAAFAGGGFMPSQATTQAHESSSSLKNRDVRTLLPLTLKQLSSASTTGESNFSIDGVDIKTVVIVGRISRMENRITQVDFVVDDGTGWVDCVRWCHARQETEEMEAVKLGMYVRLHGHLKIFQGKRSVNVFSVRPVTDFNEIVHHFTECMYVHMYNTKLRVLPYPSPLF